MLVNIFQKQKDLPIDNLSVELAVREFAKNLDQYFDEVNIHFINDAKMRKMHQTYFDDPSPTDCISFPMDNGEEDEYKIMGDVFICPHTAIQYVNAHGGNAYKEITLYLTHGLLHLVGYDDIDEEDCKMMRQAEEWHLANLESKGLLLRS